MNSSRARGVLVLALAVGTIACPFGGSTDAPGPDGGTGGGWSGAGGGGGGGAAGSRGTKCEACPRQPPEIGGLCTSIGALCAYEGQTKVRECFDIGSGLGLWEESMTVDGTYRRVEGSCPEKQPPVGSRCQLGTDACAACYYSNGCEKPTATMFCDPDSATWFQSPMDATHPQIPLCTPGSDASSSVRDSGPPDTSKADTASDPNPCVGALPSCVCTYPESYTGYTICGYGSNTDPDRYYIWPKSDSRYWGREVTCAPTSLCESAHTCDSDKAKICCSPNNSGIWNVECKFADPGAEPLRKACCK
jgi:hypothetical protein